MKELSKRILSILMTLTMIFTVFGVIEIPILAVKSNAAETEATDTIVNTNDKYATKFSWDDSNSFTIKFEYTNNENFSADWQILFDNSIIKAKSLPDDKIGGNLWCAFNGVFDEEIGKILVGCFKVETSNEIVSFSIPFEVIDTDAEKVTISWIDSNGEELIVSEYSIDGAYVDVDDSNDSSDTVAEEDDAIVNTNDKYVTKFSWDDSNSFTVSFGLVNYADFECADWSIKYDSSIIKTKGSITDHKVACDMEYNILLDNANDETGEILVGAYHADTLGTDEETVYFSIPFEVTDTDAEKVTISWVERNNGDELIVSEYSIDGAYVDVDDSNDSSDIVAEDDDAIVNTNDKYVTKFSWDDSNSFTVSFGLVNYADFSAGDWTVKYDSSIIKTKGSITDHKVAYDMEYNILLDNANDETGEILIGLYHADTLGTNEEKVYFSIPFEVIDTDAEKVTISWIDSNGEELIVSEYYLNHKHNFVESIIKDATCTQKGIKTFTCECGDTYEEEFEKVDHTLTDVAEKLATCTEDGYKAYKRCTNCDYTEGYEVIEATHALTDVAGKSATCTEDGYTAYKKCANCDYTEGYEVITATGHTVSDWTVINEATTETEGLKAKVCSKCNAQVETEIIPKAKITKLELKTSDSIKLKGENEVVILPGKKVSDILGSFNEGVVIKDTDGKEASADADIGSGFTVNLLDKDGKVLDTKTIIVPGDNDSDGRITAGDARKALRNSVKLEGLNSWQTEASKLAGNDTITAADARIILRMSVKLDKPENIFINMK